MRILSLLILLCPVLAFGQSYELQSVHSDANTSLRGLSVVSDNVAWTSGSNGLIGRTINGGKEWQWTRPKGYEKLDFRDIEAFDENRALIVNAGSPAFVLQTVDGGKNWTECYQNADTAIFLDGMSFWDHEKGIIFGDPIRHKMQLLKTNDGGKSWTDISAALNMDLADGEAGFAASGSSVKTLPEGKVWIATGGMKSNIYFSGDYGASWKRYDCPILQGNNSSGAFSIDFVDANQGIVVGGDYQKDKENANNILLSRDGGRSWNKPSRPVFGYRSGVILFDNKNCIATGTSGTDISRNGGQNWYHISDESFNTVSKAKKGNLIMLAGNKGQIYTLKIIYN